MENGKIDARVIKTKKLIEKTFIRLLEDEPFEKITTTKIIKECMISKGTFYSHYMDKYDLAEKIIDKKLKVFEELLQERFREGNRSLEDIAIVVSRAFDNSKSINVLKNINLPNKNPFILELQDIYKRIYYNYLLENNYKGILIFNL